jgi:hypothetical protein
MPAFALTLAFHGQAIEDLDEVLEVEDALYEMLADGEEMDGHEIAPHARRIFIATSDAGATFARLHAFLRNARLLDGMTASARAIDGSDDVVLWPPVAHAAAASA